MQQLMRVAVFVLTVAVRCRIISSSTVRARGGSPSFLETTDEIDTAAISTRVENVGALASDERLAVQAQQQALIALEQEEQHLASRMDSLEAKHDAAAHDETPFYLCSPKTEGTCFVEECDKSRGMVVCEMGACNCQPGVCADGHGKCLSTNPGRKLPGTYKIRLETDGSFMFMDKETITFAKRKQNHIGGDIDNFPEGHWHVVVNNDDSIMLWTDKYGPVNFLNVEDVNDEEDEDWKVTHRPFTSPWAASFEFYGKPDGQANNEFWLKHIKSKKWLTPSTPWFPQFTANSVKGVYSFPGRPGAVIFDPPLDLVHLKAAAHMSSLPLWLLLLTIGLSLA